MFFTWLKRFLPRSLYGRAAAILIIPVLMLQLVILVVFIQRHYDGVSAQMSRSMALELGLVVERVNAEADLATAQGLLANIEEPLELVIVLPAQLPLTEAKVSWLDIASRAAGRSLNERLEEIVAIQFTEDNRAQIWMTTAHGLMQVSFTRGRVAASNPHQLLVIMVVIGMLTTFISYIFLRNQLRPIKRMARAAAEFGKGRIVNFEPSGAIEVRAAGNAFLDMRNRIARQNQSRTMMLSGVSHDLRTPLTRLKLGLSMIEQDDAEVAPLMRDVEDMAQLLDTFLDFAKTDAAEEPEQVEVLAMLRQTVQDAQRAGQDVALAAQDNEDETTVFMRPMAVRRALENLLGNAMHYGTEARVSYALGPKTLRITVEDNGSGIPAQLREEAMRPFARLDPARNQNRGAGVGLGLSIVSDVARSHGGSLRLGDSDDLGGLRADIVLAR